MRVRRDANGIPIVDELDIERIADHFLRTMAPETLSRVTFTPLVDIASRLQADGFCSIRLDLDLGWTTQGHKILGYFDLNRREIAVDRSLLSDDPRFPFTLAHELGHFYLHSRAKLDLLAVDQEGRIRDSTRDLMAHRIDASRPRSLMEWQANHFAASILLPQRTVSIALVAAQRDVGVTKNLGHIWHDPRQRSSRSDLSRTIDRLSQVYRVSRSVVRYRLYDLRLVTEPARGGRPIRLGSLLTTALEELFAKG
jgi:Zn-dependent peptidase ImmA (M78 family)